MDERTLGSDRLKPASLDDRSEHEWRELSVQVMTARREGAHARTNADLRAAVEREPQSPAAPAFCLWAADNLAGQAAYRQALHAFDATLQQARDAAPLLDVLDFTVAALRGKADVAHLLGDVATEAEGWMDVLAYRPRDAEAALRTGILAEARGQPGDAALLYRSVAADKVGPNTEDERQLACRSLLRLDTPADRFLPTARLVADALGDALAERDAGRLRKLASPTHFAVGPAGGHAAFEDDDVLDHLLRDLDDSTVSVRGELGGAGDRLYVTSSGWAGRWFVGDVHLTIARSHAGWQWTGAALGMPTLAWAEHRRHPAIARTGSGDFGYDLLAPWPAGNCFRAGGATDPLYLAKITAIASLGPVGQYLFAKISKGGGCGWGIPGFYYGTPPTHQDENHYAIDFLHYNTGTPFDNTSGGTPVLAARDGCVGEVRPAGVHGGSELNRTHIYHADPENPSDEYRYMTRYLHLDGPYVDNVSTGMPIFTGNRVGRMDSTGRPPNFMKHLHFSIHDREIPHSGVDYGASIRPSPLSGKSLGDGDEATCVCSDNVELIGPRQVIYPSSYSVQNWLITPVAPSTLKSTPSDVREQRFILMLTGVAVVELKGSSSNAWKFGTVVIKPDLDPPISHACAEHGVPRPPDAGVNEAKFHVEQIVQVTGLSSIYNDNESNDSGFAVNSWGPYGWATEQDMLTGQTFDHIFVGVQAEIAARDTDAYVKRLSYNITLLGRIVFSRTFIT